MADGRLTILYRGPLASCNYGCEYCPFAKRRETDAERAEDEAALTRFVGWCLAAARPLRVFFTPWGEALTQRRYQRALAALSKAEHVEKVAVQTNLSASLDWVGEARASRLGVWATYHPGWTSLDRFVAQCERLLGWGVSFSVGVVGLLEHKAALEALRARLPPSVYVWVNAARQDSAQYTHDDVRFFESVDPLFRWNLTPHPSRGLACRAGEDVVSVDGDGTVRRCHFIPTVLGNLYTAEFEQVLRPRACTNESCRCHIGYVHLEHLELRRVFGSGLLERVPESGSQPPART